MRDGALWFGLLRAEVWYTLLSNRKHRIGWLCWFHDGSYWQWHIEEGWTQVWSAYTQEEHTSE